MLSNTATIEDQLITLANFSVENPKAEPFTIRDGRCVGQDGFVVPKDFDEFHERFPHYVRNWVRKHADKFARPEDVEDWTQDLLIHINACHPLPSIGRLARKRSCRRSTPHDIMGPVSDGSRTTSTSASPINSGLWMRPV